jgi:hypothetical protein
MLQDPFGWDPAGLHLIPDSKLPPCFPLNILVIFPGWKLGFDILSTPILMLALRPYW